MSGDTIENGDEGTSSSSRLDSILLDDFGEFCEELMVPVGGRRTMCQRCVLVMRLSLVYALRLLQRRP